VLATTTRVVVDPFADDKKPPLPGSPGGDEFIKTLYSFYDFFIHRCFNPGNSGFAFSWTLLRMQERTARDSSPVRYLSSGL